MRSTSRTFQGSSGASSASAVSAAGTRSSRCVRYTEASRPLARAVLTREHRLAFARARERVVGEEPYPAPWEQGRMRFST